MATWTIFKRLNVSPASFPTVIHIKQYSSDFILKFQLYSTDGDLNIEAGATTRIRGTKRDGNGFELTGTRIGRTCTFSGTKAQMQQMSAVAGTNVFEVVVETETRELITATFHVEVQRAAMDAGTVTSESIIEEFADFQSKITAATQAAESAEASAASAASAAEQAVEEKFEDGVEEIVDAWLTDHPEATTTVQDGAITSAKINSSFLQEIKNGYVTPEMYGAVGDGSTDDHVAINAALNNSEGKCVYFSNKTYVIADSINLTKNPIINDGTIKYTGNDYAIVLAPPTPSPGESTSIGGAYYRLGKIVASNGNCLKLDSTGAWMQYLTFDFLMMTASATGNCVYAKVVGSNWINEIRFLNGRFYGALNAVYIDHSEKTSASYTSHWTFDKVGFEGVTNGLNIPNKVTRTSFTNCRAEESLTNVVLSRAATFLINQTITWSGAIANGLYWKNCSNYIVTFLSGFMNERGVIICTDPIVFKDNMLYGIAYDSGLYGTVASYGAYSYDAETTIQTIDFKQVYDYSTENVNLYNRPFVRRFAIGNNTGATKTNIYLDDRMFLNDVYRPNNSYLLTLTLSPNVVLTIYDKEGGEVLYTKTGGSSTSYPTLKVTKANKTYYIEDLNISFKTVS